MYDYSIGINGSSINFTEEGDIRIKAKRHMIISRRLSFDNCPDQMVEEATNKYEEGPNAYYKYVERLETTTYIESEIETVRQSQNL